MRSGSWFDPRWWFRVRCNAIASTESTYEGITVRLCGRWRWHGGACR